MHNTIARAGAYFAVGAETEIFEAAWRSRLPVLLKGPTGCGKTRFVQVMAERLGRPLITVSCHEDLMGSDLVGRYLLRDGDTVWIDGPLTRAVRTGAICYLDEIVEARADTTVVIHSLTDHRRELYIDRLGEQLAAPPEFMLVLSYNPGYQTVLKDLKPSTRQRLVSIALTYPDAEIERRILAAETGIDPELADRFVRIAQAIRRLDNEGLAETASTRTLVSAALLVTSGLPALEAARAAIAGSLTDDPALLEKLGDLAALYLA